MKIAINKCYGGFSCSDALMTELDLPIQDSIIPGMNHLYNEMFDIKDGNYNAHRTDPRLIAAIEKLGDAASGPCGDLAIVEIPDDVDWEISEYDGMETVEEVHRSW